MSYNNETLVAFGESKGNQLSTENQINQENLSEEEGILYGKLAFVLKEIQKGNIHNDKINQVIQESDENLKYLLYIIAYGKNKDNESSEFLANIPNLGDEEQIRFSAKTIVDNYLTKLEQKEIYDSLNMNLDELINLNKQQAKILYYSKANEIRYNNFQLTIEDATMLLSYLGIMEYESVTAFLGAGGGILKLGPISIEEYFPFENEQEKEYAIEILKSSQRKE